MLDKYQSTDFLPRLNQTFRICLEGLAPIDLELVAVNELATTAQPGARRPFSLHFLGPVSSQYLLQHIYQMENQHLGMLDLFIVPLGPEAGRMRYEAIFT